MADRVHRGEHPPPGAGYVAHTQPPVAAPPPTCLGCGVTLHLTPDRYGCPAIDAMNLASGTCMCQTCILEKLREGATR